MRVAVVGTGYVGLVTGACLASIGHTVTCLDTDRDKIELLQAGGIPIFEPGLPALVADQMVVERLSFSSEPEAIEGAEVVFICVGTPPLGDGRADTAAVEAVARTIGKYLGQPYTVVVIKSTVPVGSGDLVGTLIKQGIRDGLRFDVVANPEFRREGSAVEDALAPDRIVVGSDSNDATRKMRELYWPLVERAWKEGRTIPFLVTDLASAQLIKYAANAMLATRISFINEVAHLCDCVGADVLTVARGIGLDARIGPAFLRAGLGWGGSCFPKDLSALIFTAREHGYQPRLLEAVCDINADQQRFIIQKLQVRLKQLRGKTIGIWGLTFKPGTDDLRESPALAIAERIAEMGADVHVYDPQGMDGARRQGLDAEFCADPYAVAHEADAVILTTDWPEFAHLNWGRVQASMRHPLIIDGRNALDRSLLIQHGFEYCGVGR
jgi:UDPglucose 6-dehydrogenase